MAIVCPECEEKIPNDSEECPECGAEIDPDLRVNRLRVFLLVASIVLILFVAIPSIFRTLFHSEPITTDLAPVVPLTEIRKRLGDEQILKIQKQTLTRGEEIESQVKMHWKVEVKNGADSPILFDTDIRLLDESGVEIQSDYRLETELVGSATRSLQGAITLSTEDAERVKSMRAIVQPSDEVAQSDEE